MDPTINIDSAHTHALQLASEYSRDLGQEIKKHQKNTNVADIDAILMKTLPVPIQMISEFLTKDDMAPLDVRTESIRQALKDIPAKQQFSIHWAAHLQQQQQMDQIYKMQKSIAEEEMMMKMNALDAYLDDDDYWGEDIVKAKEKQFRRKEMEIQETIKNLNENAKNNQTFHAPSLVAAHKNILGQILQRAQQYINAFELATTNTPDNIDDIVLIDTDIVTTQDNTSLEIEQHTEKETSPNDQQESELDRRRNVLFNKMMR